jgi:hypothetical protein
VQVGVIQEKLVPPAVVAAAMPSNWAVMTSSGSCWRVSETESWLLSVEAMWMTHGQIGQIRETSCEVLSELCRS